MVLKYAVFKSSEEFESWQGVNPDFEVRQITPLVSGMSFDINADKGDNAMHGKTDVTVFVIYNDNTVLPYSTGIRR